MFVTTHIAIRSALHAPPALQRALGAIGWIWTLRPLCLFLLVAPLDANTLARLALGLCPNLLTCTVRVWNRSNSSPILAPAMNTQMWNQNITKTHLDTLKKRGAAIVSPQVKTLACGDHGKGAMADPEGIVRVVLETLQKDT